MARHLVAKLGWKSGQAARFGHVEISSAGRGGAGSRFLDLAVLAARSDPGFDTEVLSPKLGPGPQIKNAVYGHKPVLQIVDADGGVVGGGAQGHQHAQAFGHMEHVRGVAEPQLAKRAKAREDGFAIGPGARGVLQASGEVPSLDPPFQIDAGGAGRGQAEVGARSGKELCPNSGGSNSGGPNSGGSVGGLPDGQKSVVHFEDKGRCAGIRAVAQQVAQGSGVPWHEGRVAR